MDSDQEPQNILLEQYKILFDLIKLQHQRTNSFTTIFLTAHALLAASLAHLAKDTNMDHVLVYVGIAVGVILCILWFLVMSRLKLDTKMRWSQLRSIESQIPNCKRIAREGYEFFKRMGCNIFAKVRVVDICRLLPILFLAFYVFLFFYVKGMHCNAEKPAKNSEYQGQASINVERIPWSRHICWPFAG